MEGLINQKKQIYYGIDVFKLIFSLLIVYTHTYCYDLGRLGNWIQQVLSGVGVPFFFIVSGFFYAKGLNRAADKKQYFYSYFKRMAKLYLVWTIISLPMFWKTIVMAHGDYSFLMKCIYLIRSILFSGSMGVYWYILSLLYISVIVYFVNTHKKFEIPMYIASCIFFCIGIVYMMGNPDRNMFFHLLHAVFGSERNFLTVGLFYTSIGYYFANRENKYNVIKIACLLFITILLKTYEVKYLEVHFMQAFIAIFAFLLSINLPCKNLAKYCGHFRKLSTAIYLEHFMIILWFDFYLQRGTIVDFTFTLVSSILIYLVVLKTLPKKIVSTIYGEKF